MYTISISDLPDRLCGIYKIDFPNGKIYIGQSNNIKRRMYEHNNIKKNAKIKYCQVCDRAIIKYGRIINLTILEECLESQLDEKERYWIHYYHSYEKEKGYNIERGGKKSSHTYQRLLTDEEILDIRQRRFQGERKKDVYLLYQNKISWGGFERTWLGTTNPQIGKEFLVPFINKTRQEYSHEANDGSKNGQAKMTKEQIVEIRYLFEHRDKKHSDRKTILQLAKNYSLSVTSVYNIVHYNSYKDVEPVSTIPYVETQGSSATIDT